MDPDRERRLPDLLFEAFERPEGERRSFLEAACAAADDELLAAALACLAHEKELGDFLAGPALAAADRQLGTTLGAGKGRGAPPVTATVAEPYRRPVEPTAPHPPPESFERRLDRERLGAYRIVGHVGSGGMGQVYMGEDPRLGRRVAIKILPPETAEQPQLLARFEREARALAALNHPNIVTIHSVEEDDGIPFLTMELVEGKTLDQVVPQGGLPTEELLDIAVDLAGALAAAHERGVIHRDLKPANVMVTVDGRVKILDFGIAKVTWGDQRDVSRAGTVVGTVAFMAPEQLRGATVDARADLFSLGVVLYLMATGRHPFPARSVGHRVSAILGTEPPPAGKLRPQLPGALDEIIARCLEKDPVERLQSAGALRDELADLREELLAEKILETRKVPIQTLPEPTLWRRPMILAAVAVLVLLALAVAFVRQRPPATAEATAAGGPPRTPLTVLWFHNLASDPELDWLATGITELLVTDLSQSPGLDVLGTGELYRIALGLGARLDVAPAPEVVGAVAEKAAAAAVLSGSYVRLGDVLRIAYTLEEPLTGEILRSQSLEGQGEESLFGLVDQLSAAVRETFDAARPDLSPETVKEATTGSLPALQAFTDARILYLESKIEEAIARLEEALEIDPDFALASVMIAKFHQSLGHNAEAEAYARAAFELVERLPLDTRFDVEGGYYGTRWTTLGRAIETYDLALKVYPDKPGWRNNLARRYAFFERYSEAIEEFQRMIDGGTEFWGNYYGLANALAALGDFETGYRLLADFAAERPDNWLHHYVLAWHLTEWGKAGKSAEAFARVAEIRPESPQLHYGRWRLETLRQDWQQADREAERLLALEGSFARFRGSLSLAQGALYRGRSEAALVYLDDALGAAAGADRALVRCFKAELLLARGEAGRVLEEARRAREEGSGQWPELRGIYLAARAEEALGRSAAADILRGTLRERWRRQPNAVEERQLHHLSGLLALARGDPEEALTELERAAALLPAKGIEFSWHVFPHHVPIWTALGEAELAAGRPEAALGWLSRAATSGSERLERPLAYVTSLYFEGLAHLRRGEPEAARQSFERFLGYWESGDLRREWVAEARSHL